MRFRNVSRKARQTSHDLRWERTPRRFQQLTHLARGSCALWVKRDDLTSPLYGGNKVRKLEYLLADARARGATRLVTIGAVGSHHVLATTLTAGRRGSRSRRRWCRSRRRRTWSRSCARASGAGCARCRQAGTRASRRAVLPRVLATGAYFVTVGGSSAVGSLGYVDAARELAAQVRGGEMPEPDLVVVALGSGGTVAGLAAGLEAEGLQSKVLGVIVAEPPWFVAWRARRLARACLRRTGVRARRGWLDERMTIDGRWLGAGYGHATDAGERATTEAAEAGLTLDPTYTAKTFAAATARVRAWSEGATPRTVLYWHTLSSAPVTPLLERAPNEDALDPRVRELFV